MPQKKITIGFLFSGNATLAEGLITYMKSNSRFASHFVIKEAFTNHEPDLRKKGTSSGSLNGYRLFAQNFHWHPYCVDMRTFASSHGCTLAEFLRNTDLRTRYAMDYIKYALSLNKSAQRDRRPVDLVICAGFDFLLPDPLIAYFGNILNEHPADLRILDPDGRPRYRGYGTPVVAKTIADGSRETRSTIHLIEPGKSMDAGRIICTSKPIKIAKSATPEHAFEVQLRMKERCAVPALIKALDLILRGKVNLPRPIAALKP